MSKTVWLVASDIHGSHELWDKILTESRRNTDISSIVLCGDLTNYGKQNDWHNGPGGYEDFLEAESMIKQISEIKPVFWIPGNHDWNIESDDFNYSNVQCINNITTTIDGYIVRGVNHSPCFGAEDLAIDWRNMSADQQDDDDAFGFDVVDVVVSHCPPYRVLDDIGGVNIGSPALALYIKTFSPKYVFCGHAHEGGGEAATLGSTFIANVATCLRVIQM